MRRREMMQSKGADVIFLESITLKDSIWADVDFYKEYFSLYYYVYEHTKSSTWSMAIHSYPNYGAFGIQNGIFIAENSAGKAYNCGSFVNGQYAVHNNNVVIFDRIDTFRIGPDRSGYTITLKDLKFTYKSGTTQTLRIAIKDDEFGMYCVESGKFYKFLSYGGSVLSYT